MKKTMSVLMALLFALPISFAKISTYGDYSDSVGIAVVGEKGYVETSSSNRFPEVFACAPKDGTIKYYGMNLNTDSQKSLGENLLLEVISKMDFSVFDHFGCLRATI